MTRAPKTITVSPDSELGLLLKDAAATGGPVLVDTGEAIYTLEIDPAAETTAAPQQSPRLPSPAEGARSREGIRNAAGSWKDVDREEFLAYIAERRGASGRPPVRL